MGVLAVMPYHLNVFEFHRAFDVATNQPLSSRAARSPHPPPREECEELGRAVDAVKLAATPVAKVEAVADLLKELADVQYTVTGFALTFGLPLGEAFPANSCEQHEQAWPRWSPHLARGTGRC